MNRKAALLTVLALSLVLLWRRPDAALNPQFWAEDGNVFFMQAREHGIASLWLPYSGYLHDAARAAAWAATSLPIGYAPHAYALASWLLLVLLVLYVFSGRLDLRTHERVVLAMALVCTTTSNEVFFNLANWATLTALWLILLATAREPRGVGQTLFDIAALAVAGLNTPFAVCLWVLFLLRFWWRRTRQSAILLLVSVTVALIQLSHMGTRIAETPAGPLLNRVDGLAYRLGFIFFGDAMYGLQLATPERALVLAGLGLLYGFAMWRAWTIRAQPALTFLLAHGLLILVSFFVTRTWSEASFFFHTGRHQYLPAVTLVWAFACLRTPPAQWIPVGVAFAAFAFLNPSSKNEVHRDLHWEESVARCREQPGPCQIAIHPITPPPQLWIVTITKTP